mgnify:CR=1 FL=1
MLQFIVKVYITPADMIELRKATSLTAVTIIKSLQIHACIKMSMAIMNLSTVFRDLAQNSQIKESNISEFLIFKKQLYMLPLRDLWEISEFAESDYSKIQISMQLFLYIGYHCETISSEKYEKFILLFVLKIHPTRKN